jgi:hypothetical protein
VNPVRGRVEIAAVIAVAMITVTAIAHGLQRDARAERVRRQLFAAIQPVHVTNCELARFGAVNDGGYLVCANLLDAVTAAYSYGIEGRDEWGCQISETLDVPVQEYDCFDVRRPMCAEGRLVFHPECVGPSRATHDGKFFDSIAAQVERNGDAGKTLVVKIDVEGAEWDSFLATPPSVFDRIDQLIVEFHGVDDERYLRTIEKLKESFVFAHVHYNNGGCKPDIEPFPSWVFEALLVNKRLAQTDGEPAPPSPLPNLDAPNGAHSPDCQSVK